jgi:hypothetical protein
VSTLAARTPRLDRARSLAARGASWVEARPPFAVLAAAIAVEWLATLGLALTVRHNGWIYYQGGDQLWYYTLGWLLAHGHIWQTPVGYLWSFWQTPIAGVAGPNTASGMPAIVLLNVLVLVPVAMLALYGIAARLGGRLFGYWTLLVWIVTPFLGILYTDQGYHQRYTEAVLPQGFGLTAMADFPTMVATLVALYFCARVVLDATPQLLDAAAAGLAFGAAIATKPSVSLVLLGPPLAFLARRRYRELAALAAGLVPSLVTLTVWKDRGLGHAPLLGAPPPHPPSGLAAVAPVLGLNLHKYTGQLSWQHLSRNIDLLREHFWSGHGAVWLLLAGLIAIGLRSRPALLLIGGSFLPFALAKSSYTATVEDTSVFRILIPAFPMFVLGLAALVYLLPGTRGAQPSYVPIAHPLSQRTRVVLLALVVVSTAIVPLAATAAAKRSGPPYAAELGSTQTPVPIGIDLHLRATVKHGTVLLTWREQHPAGGAVFYRVARLHAAPGDGLSCQMVGAQLCRLEWDEVGVTRQGARYDTPGKGTWVYRVGVAVNWLNDPSQGDVYIASRPLVVHVP